MESVADAWNRYWNGSSYRFLLPAAVLILLVLAKKYKKAGELAVYQILIALVFVCPATAWFIQKCVGELVYWRTLWLFPVVPAIALAMTLLVKSCKPKWGKGVLAALFLAAAVFAGTSVWQAGNFVKTGNRQQVPDPVAAAAGLIAENRTSEESLAAVDDFIASYIRVYDPSIRMPYGREARGAESRNAKALYLEIMNPEPVYHHLARRASVMNCEFLVFEVPEEKESRICYSVGRYGYELIGKADRYGVFQKKK